MYLLDPKPNVCVAAVLACIQNTYIWAADQPGQLFRGMGYSSCRAVSRKLGSVVASTTVELALLCRCRFAGFGGFTAELLLAAMLENCHCPAALNMPNTPLPMVFPAYTAVRCEETPSLHLL